MAGSESTLALEALIAALATPSGIHPALARQVSADAARALRPTLHRRVPSPGSPLAAFRAVSATLCASPHAHL